MPFVNAVDPALIQNVVENVPAIVPNQCISSSTTGILSPEQSLGTGVNLIRTVPINSDIIPMPTTSVSLDQGNNIYVTNICLTDEQKFINIGVTCGGTNLCVGLIENNVNYINQASCITRLGFNCNSGLTVTDLGSGTASVNFGGSFKCIEVNGGAGIIATGLDTINFVAGTGISLTSNNSSSPKSLTISSTSITNTVTSLNSLTGAITLSAGTNISIGCSGNTLTINSTSGGVSLDANCSLSIGGGLGSSTGTNNLAIGYQALQSNTSGSNNLGYGEKAGCLLTTGGNNTIIGSLPGTAGLNNTVLLGAGSTERLKIDSTGLYINNTGVGSAITFRNVYQTITSLSGATGVVVHDFSLGSLFDHTNIAGNFTVNVTNLNLNVGMVANVTLVLHQGIIPYVPNSFQIAGAVQTIYWVYGVLPGGTVSGKDIVNFSITNIGSAYTVFGQLVSYG